jgi:hypothetical protein
MSGVGESLRPVVLNAGCGAADESKLPAYFQDWQHLRVDINPLTEPDIVASICDLSAIPDGTVDAIWSAHCVEHLFHHEVQLALGEFRRVLAATGFACIIVPDLQAIADWVASDRLNETIYESAAGPVTAHDMLWGFGPAIAKGDFAMAHRCGFTPSVFLERLQAAGFPEIVLRRRTNLELGAVVMPQIGASNERRDSLLTALAV